MTKGGPNGTNGWPRFEWLPWLTVAIVGVSTAFVNATSELMEAARDDRVIPIWAPFLWEYSSCVMLLVLAPFIGEAVRRWPLRREGLPLTLLIHAGLTIVYSLLHVGGFVALRKLGYALAGSVYDFSHGVLPLVLVYEWRKDVIGYVVVGAVYWYFQHRAQQQAARPTDARIEIRDGGAAVFLPPADILWVEAAGNYVEFNTAAKTHLVRGTLASWEARLAAAGFARVHRSRLVNRARIRALKPTSAGDLEITLDDGRTLLGSRRYRAALETAA